MIVDSCSQKVTYSGSYAVVIKNVWKELVSGNLADAIESAADCHMTKAEAIADLLLTDDPTPEAVELIEYNLKLLDRRHITAEEAACNISEELFCCQYWYRRIHGSVQGEEAVVFYPIGSLTDVGLGDIEMEYFNLGDEYIVEGDNLSVYITSDDAKEGIADAVGCKPSDVLFEDELPEDVTITIDIDPERLLHLAMSGAIRDNEIFQRYKMTEQSDETSRCYGELHHALQKMQVTA